MIGVTLWEDVMLRTITMGSHVSIQGFLVNKLADGKMTVKVGDKIYTGKPVLPKVIKPKKR